MDWLWTLLVFGGFWFWAAVVVESLFLIFWVSSDNEESSSGFWATVSVIITVLLFQFLGGPSLLRMVAENPWPTLFSVGGYFFIGTIWGVIKWYLYVLQKKEEYEEEKAAYTPDGRGRTWEEYIRNKMPKGTTIVPQAAKHKARILRWMTFWPWSAVWSLLNDVVRRVFHFLYTKIKWTLQRIADSVFHDIMTKDFPPRQ